MKNEQKTFSLSHYFDELRRKKEEKKGMKGGAHAGSSFAAHLSVIKSLMAAKDNAMPFMVLAKTSQLNLDACKEIIESLQEEGIVEIEPDYDTGNDLVRLTQKGKEALS